MMSTEIIWFHPGVVTGGGRRGGCCWRGDRLNPPCLLNFGVLEPAAARKECCFGWTMRIELAAHNTRSVHHLRHPVLSRRATVDGAAGSGATVGLPQRLWRLVAAEQQRARDHLYGPRSSQPIERTEVKRKDRTEF
eukprot:SAG22_NODE_465_length_10181_cov_6.604444_1_plen_136_part_00